MLGFRLSLHLFTLSIYYLCPKDIVMIWASLVAQWLRICMPMQGTRVQALVREDPTGCGVTRPVRHNY